MLTEGNIIRLTVKAHLLDGGTPVNNVYHYQAEGVVGDWSATSETEQLITDFAGTVLTVISNIQSNRLAYDEIVFDNMTNLIDQTTYTPPAPLFGAVESGSEPGNVSASFKLIRTTRVTRHGRKSIGGIADNLVTVSDGSSMDGLATVTAIEEVLAESIDIVAGDGVFVTLHPVIVRRPAVGLPVTVFNYVASAEFRGVGSQASRTTLL